MSKVRMFGLVLITTTLIIAMAAMVTETFEIRIHRFYHTGMSSSSSMPESTPQPSQPAEPSEFVEIPILVPLAAAGGLGLLFWFVPSGLSSANNKPTFSSRRKRIPRR